MANFFDQFDEKKTSGSKAGGNFFDQFDESAKPMSISEMASQAAQNIQPSAIEYAKNIVQPIIHPIDTAQNLYSLGKGLGAKGMLAAFDAMGRPVTPEARAEVENLAAPATAVGEHFAGRYGGVENIKRTVAQDPVGTLGDLSMILSAGGTAGSRLPGMLGRAGEVVAATGAAIDPLSAAGSAVKTAYTGGRVPFTNINVPGAESAISTLLGRTTGAGAEAVRAAGTAGLEGNQAFTQNLRGNVPFSDVVDMAKQGVSSLKEERGAAYREGMQGVNTDKSILDYNPINQKLESLKGMVEHKGSVVSESGAKILQDIKDTVMEWQTNPKMLGNVEDFDALKKSVGDIRSSTQEGTVARKIADESYNIIKDQITQQAPKYAEVMKGYSGASKELRDITKTFSLGEKASTDTALRKLQSVMRNNVNTNYGARAQLMDQLAEKVPNLPAAIAGQALSSPWARGITGVIAPYAIPSAAGAIHVGASLGNPVTAGLLAGGVAAHSPRIVGEAAYGAGRALGAAQNAQIPMALRNAGRAGLLAPQQEYDENGEPIFKVKRK
jgi:ribosomal protein S19E (S16A)